ncbi:hypothetical protein HZC21_01920 [Candidatus Peregrinibacteria bacterium]|nr:hypothetical protein [Candidatus Peregrinibacteria bacterium]
MLKRAIKVVIYTDPELVFTCYEDYAEELNPIEITDRVLRKIAREKPEMFFKYRDEWCKGMPDEEALIKQALKSLFAENSLKSWTYFQNYVDKPYAYEILKAQIEKQAFHVIQHFPVYEDQPYADEILQAALAQDQEAAVRFFEKYQDRPYARRVFRNASRKHPEALLGGLYQRRYRPESPFEKKKLEKLACVTVKVKPGRVLWLYPIFLNNRLDPSRLEELNLLEKAARGSAEKDPGNFFERFEDCIIDKPYADEVLEKALRTALEMCPKIAVENSYLYRDKPYYDEIFLASAMKSAESNPGEMFWCFNDDYSHPPFKDNPYREQILRKTVMAAVEKDPQAAISCFEYYQDQPYAEEMFKKAMAGSADVEKSIPGFVPEFTQENIAAVYSGMHDVVGKYTIEVYEVKYKGQKFEWEMAYDKKGRVWIEGINVADCPVNTFGVRSQFINSGILTKKPFDYHDGNRGLKRGAEKRYYDKSYDDVTPFLDLLPPIKKFRRQRGIFRKRSVQRRSEKN